MVFCSTLLALIILSIEIIIIVISWPYSLAPQNCSAQRPGRDGDCYFNIDFELGANSYTTAKEKFIKAAKAIKGSELYSLSIYKHYTTDIAIIPGSNDSNSLLLHISGTHGPEGYAGSAIQRAYLNSIKKRDNKKSKNDIKNRPTEIFVHALNPYGFDQNRRVNEDNIDLNRNFLTEDEFKFATSRDPNFANYINMDGLFNPSPASLFTNNRYINLLLLLIKSLYYSFTNDMVSIKRAMVSGNYHNPNGLYYGGTKMSNSASKLIEFLTKYMNKRNNDINNNDDDDDNNDNDNDNDDQNESVSSNSNSIDKVVVVDVHTGLGYSGVDTLAIDGGSGHLASEIYPDSIIERVDRSPDNEIDKGSSSNKDHDAMSGYELMMGGVPQYFCKTFLPFQDTTKLCVTQEFGTVAPFFVAQALIEENFAYHYSNILGNAYSFEAGLHLKNAFYREGSSIVARDWQRNVVDRGLEVIQESLKALTITEERTLKPKSYMKIEGVMHREHRRKIASSNRKQ